MAIIENIKDTISKTGRSAVKKTKDLAGLARVNSRIEETKELIDAVYAEIGRKYCELYTKETAGEEFAIDVATVENLKEQLDALSQEKLALKGKVKCEKCGKTSDDDYAFCPFCGERFPEPAVAEEKAPELASAEEDVFDDEDEEVEE